MRLPPGPSYPKPCWEFWKAWIGEIRTPHVGVNASSWSAIWPGEQNCVAISELKVGGRRVARRDIRVQSQRQLNLVHAILKVERALSVPVESRLVYHFSGRVFSHTIRDQLSTRRRLHTCHLRSSFTRIGQRQLSYRTL